MVLSKALLLSSVLGVFIEALYMTLSVCYWIYLVIERLNRVTVHAGPYERFIDS